MELAARATSALCGLFLANDVLTTYFHRTAGTDLPANVGFLQCRCDISKDDNSMPGRASSCIVYRQRKPTDQLVSVGVKPWISTEPALKLHLFLFSTFGRC